MRAAKAYLDNDVDTSVASFNPTQIIVLLYERIFDQLRLAKKSLENEEYGVEHFSRAHDLIQQGLLACLDYEEGGNVATSLGSVYEWALREILSARLNKSASKVQEVIDVLTLLHEGWLALAPKDSVISLKSYDNELPHSMANSY